MCRVKAGKGVVDRQFPQIVDSCQGLFYRLQTLHIARGGVAGVGFVIAAGPALPAGRLPRR